MIKPPPPDIAPGDHILGPADAPVTLCEYGDYECPYCGRAHPVLMDALQRVGPYVRFVYRHFPLFDKHPHALAAAEAAEAAGVQGKFWPMHDMIYENQRALESSDLIARAEILGLDVDRFTAELATRAHLPRVKADADSGLRIGVHGTPALYIQGDRFEGSRDADALAAALRSALHATRLIA
jgi:protein-disulfide isomerase